MKSLSVLALSLALTSALAAAPADAQRRKKGEVVVPTVDPNARKFVFSKAARVPLQTLQNAVNAKDAAAVAAALPAAQATAASSDERYVLAQLQYQHATDRQDVAGQRVALNAIVQSGGAAPSELPAIYRNMGNLAYNAQDWPTAATAFERLIQLEPNNSDALVSLAEIRHRRGQTAEGIQFLERAIAVKRAAGQPIDESWYKRGIHLSANAKLAPQALKLNREWLVAYPTTQNWRDALNNYRALVPLDEGATLDHFRLQRASGALTGERDYRAFANELNRRRFYGEAKAVLDDGVSKRIIDPAKPEYRALIAQVGKSAASDRPTIAASESKAQSAATANVALNVADAYFGYADYAKASSFYRTALTKTGADANLINTRLGIALAMSGDKAGAATALNAVTGPRQELAQYWLLWLNRRA